MVEKEFLKVDEFENALLTFNRVKAEKIVNDLISSGFSSFSIVENLIKHALEKIGTGWANGTRSLSQVYMGGRICENIIELILPKNEDSFISAPVTAVAVYDDYHMLGEKIVCAFLRSAGYKVLDYGRVEDEKLLEKIKRDKVEIILISTLMLNAALKLKDLIRRAKAESAEIKVVVGGAPFNFDPELWKEIGADRVSSTASAATSIIEELKNERKT